MIDITFYPSKHFVDLKQIIDFRAAVSLDKAYRLSRDESAIFFGFENTKCTLFDFGLAEILTNATAIKNLVRCGMLLKDITPIGFFREFRVAIGDMKSFGFDEYDLIETLKQLAGIFEMVGEPEIKGNSLFFSARLFQSKCEVE